MRGLGSAARLHPWPPAHPGAPGCGRWPTPAPAAPPRAACRPRPGQRVPPRPPPGRPPSPPGSSRAAWGAGRARRCRCMGAWVIRPRFQGEPNAHACCTPIGRGGAQPALWGGTWRVRCSHGLTGALLVTPLGKWKRSRCARAIYAASCVCLHGTHNLPKTARAPLSHACGCPGGTCLPLLPAPLPAPPPSPRCLPAGLPSSGEARWCLPWPQGCGWRQDLGCPGMPSPAQPPGGEGWRSWRRSCGGWACVQGGARTATSCTTGHGSQSVPSPPLSSGSAQGLALSLPLPCLVHTAITHTQVCRASPRQIRTPLHISSIPQGWGPSKARAGQAIRCPGRGLSHTAWQWVAHEIPFTTYWCVCWRTFLRWLLTSEPSRVLQAF